MQPQRTIACVVEAKVKGVVIISPLSPIASMIFFKREVAIREQGDILHAEVLLQLRFEPLVLFTHIGEPMAVPDAADLIAVLLKLRDGRAGDIDYFGHILLQSAADAATKELICGYPRAAP